MSTWGQVLQEVKSIKTYYLQPIGKDLEAIAEAMEKESMDPQELRRLVIASNRIGQYLEEFRKGVRCVTELLIEIRAMADIAEDLP